MPIIHEYHYPGGPLTYEYPLGSSIPPEHLASFSPFVRELAELSAEAIRERLVARWQGIHADIEPIAEYLLSLEFSAVAFTEEGRARDSWLILRGAADQLALLAAPPERSAEVGGAEWIQQHPSLSQLLAHFGDLQVGMIPPRWGFKSFARLIHEADDKLCWGPTGAWENALPIHHDGSGNILCVAPAGRVGLWSHDVKQRPFQEVAASLAEFVRRFVQRQRTGQAPPDERWW